MSSKTLNTEKPSLANITGKIRSIGNSKGIILSNQILQKAGLSSNVKVSLTVHKGEITISDIKKENVVNTDLNTWEKQFKIAIKKGNKPDKDLFENVKNNFDLHEWSE